MTLNDSRVFSRPKDRKKDDEQEQQRLYKIEKGDLFVEGTGASGGGGAQSAFAGQKTMPLDAFNRLGSKDRVAFINAGGTTV